jgi:4-methylaminobutanoate oxidase (formaldehyde-forming)
LWGGELVLRDGVAAGQVMSAAWGEAVGAPVGLAYVWDPAGGVVTPDFLRAGRYEVNVGGDIRPVTVSLRPPFDPAGTRVRGHQGS